MGFIETLCTFLGGVVALGAIIAFIRRYFFAPPQETWVHLDFPTESGLQQQLEGKGYGVAWCGDNTLQNTLRDGAEVVIEQKKWGRRTVYRHEDRPHNLTLIKKKEVESRTTRRRLRTMIVSAK
jgi:hypothetical protein